MKHLIRLMIILGIATFVLSACDQEPAPRSKQVNLLVAHEGQVWLRRQGWDEFVPIAFGALIKEDDRLKVEGSALLLCANLTIKEATKQGTQPCPVEQGLVVYKRNQFNSGTRDFAFSNVPYILHPRNALLLDSRPVLRWHDSGATSYTVEIRQNGLVWQKTGVEGTQMPYPEDEPALQPGKEYLLKVTDETSNRHSGEEKVKGLGFQVLSEEQLAAIEERSEAIMSLESVDKPARDFALAIYYAGLELEQEHGLWGEAWLLLESVAQTENTPAVQLLMGDMLLAMKLPNDAYNAYDTAFELAEELGDKESQAAAKAGLWRATKNKASLDEAIEIYEALGDKNAVERLLEEANPSE